MRPLVLISRDLDDPAPTRFAAALKNGYPVRVTSISSTNLTPSVCSYLNMKSIELLAHLSMSSPAGMAKDLEVNELLNGPFGRILEIRLQNGAILKRHKADEPITVLCLSGEGVFRAGAGLEDSREMVAGTFITLAAGIEHDFTANTAASILVTRFKAAQT